jgi:hypothetical protein
MRLILALVILAIAVYAAEPAGGQAPPTIVTLADPADGILSPDIEGPFAHLTLSVNQTALLDAGRRPVPYLAVSARVDGQPLPWAAQSIARGEPTFRIEPCALPGGSDLPGTPIIVDYTVQFQTVDDGETIPPESGAVWLALGADTRAPVLRVVSPSVGQQVKPGDTVMIVLAAEEPENAGAWQTGLRRVELRDPDGRTQEQTTGADGPRACADKVRSGEAAFRYEVPPDAAPGRPLEFVAAAIDWADNRATRPFTLVVEGGDTWTGRLTAGSSAVSVGLSGSIAADSAQGTFSFIVAPDGTLSGRGTATVMTPPTQVSLEGGTCMFTHVQEPAQFEIEVQGRRTGTTFELQIRAPGVATRTTTAVCSAAPEPQTNTTTISRFGYTSMTGGPESGGFVIMAPAEENRPVQLRNVLDLGSGSVEQTVTVEIARARS